MRFKKICDLISYNGFKDLHTIDAKLTGLLLKHWVHFPFLNSALTLACFRCFGCSPSLKLFLQIT